MENATPTNPTRQHKFDGREFAAKSSCSVILIVVLLFLIRPLMVSQLLSRADAYSTCGLYDESKRQCGKVLLIDGGNSTAWYLLGCVHKARKETDQAYAAFNRATQTDPTNVPAQFELGMMYAQDNLHRQAIPCFEEVRTCTSEEARKGSDGAFSHHRAALNMLVFCYEKTGESAKARMTREELRVYYPDQTQSSAGSAADVPPAQ